MPHGQLAKLVYLYQRTLSQQTSELRTNVNGQSSRHDAKRAGRTAAGKCKQQITVTVQESVHMRVKNGSAQIIVFLQAYVGTGGLQGRACVFTIFGASYISGKAVDKVRTGL